MHPNYRCKVLHSDCDALLANGMGINTHECQSGEYWIVGRLDKVSVVVKKLQLKVLIQPERV